MNTELQTILNYMEKDRGINREVLLEAVEYALQSAARRNYGEGDNLRVEIDRNTCDIKAFSTSEVVDAVHTHAGQVTLEKARRIRDNVSIGDMIEVEVTPKNFGRIAAQTAKQAILQRIRQAERDIVFDEYKDRLGDIVTGSVRQFNRSDIIIDLGRAQAIIPSNERVPTEEYQMGDRIRAYVIDIKPDTQGPAIILSRSHPNFVRKLFELEVAEIADGIVEIKGIAREPGYRTKIAVVSKETKVDPVGACVGMRGMRVKNIVRELSGEKIDIIRWSDDPKTYVISALSPAKLQKVEIDVDNAELIHVIADSEQLSLAIGKRGQNVRLTAKLLGMKIDIQKDESEVTFEEKVARAVDSLAEIKGVERNHAEILVNSGFLTIEGLLSAEITDIIDATGLEEEIAKMLVGAATEATQLESERQENNENT